jgi:acetylornithine deacetylase/succinyl-diaminopimelate desuccinylase-like protein
MKKAWFVLAALAVAFSAGNVSAETPQSWRDQARRIFAKAIGFQTEIGRNQVPAMAEYLAGLFRAGGFPDADIHVVPLGETASLVVRYAGDGSGGRPVLLMAHMDVVTAKREEWQRDPYTLVEEDGFFYGRGTLDIKEDLVQLTTIFLRLKAEGYQPTRDLVIAFTGDEETAQDCIQDLVTNHRDLVDAEFALNGDGGGGVLDDATGRPLVAYLQGAEKASATFELTVHGPGGHSSAPREPNPIYQLADALKAVQAYRFPVMSNEWTLKSFEASARTTPGELGEAMGRFAANPGDAAAADVLAREPQLVGRTRTTCVATQLEAGHASNALPQTATAVVNCRVFPGMSVASVQSTLERLAGEAVEVKRLGATIVADASPLRPDVVAAVGAAMAATYPGVAVVPDMPPYATDGATVRAAGIPTYGASGTFIKPGDDYSHGLNERLPVASFYKGLDYYYVLLKAVGSHGGR